VIGMANGTATLTGLARHYHDTTVNTQRQEHDKGDTETNDTMSCVTITLASSPPQTTQSHVSLSH